MGSILKSVSWEFPNLVVSNLAVCNFCEEALFCTLLRLFALFCALLHSFADLRLHSFALICALLRAFACFCIRLRLERPRLGTADYRLPFWREVCWVLQVRVDSGVDTEFPYRVRIVDRVVVCHDPVKSGKYPLGCSSMCCLSWFSGPGFCSCPGFHLRLGASDCYWASILLYRPLDIAWICCPQLPHHPCKTGTHNTCFYSTGGHTTLLNFAVTVSDSQILSVL